MSERNAQNFMAVAERFGGKIVNLTNIPPSALYLLAAPSTPETVVAAVERREVEPTHAAIKRAVEEARAQERTQASELVHSLNLQLGQARDEVARLRDARTMLARRIAAEWYECPNAGYFVAISHQAETHLRRAYRIPELVRLAPDAGKSE